MSHPVKKFALNLVAENVSKLDEGVNNFGPEEEHFGVPWKLCYKKSNGHLAVFLHCFKPLSMTPWAINVKKQFTVASSKNKKIQKNTFDSEYKKPFGYGDAAFIEWKDLEKNYLVDDKIEIAVIVLITKMVGIKKNKNYFSMKNVLKVFGRGKDLKVHPTEPENSENEGPIKEFTLTHVFQNMSKSKDVTLYSSPEVEQFNIPWKLSYKKTSTAKIGLFLYCNRNLTMSEWAVQAKCTFKMTSSNGKSFQMEVNNIEFKYPTDYGTANFMAWDDMVKDYLIDDKIIIEAHVQVLKMSGIEEKPRLKIFDDDVAKLNSDVTLIVENEQFYVTKAILAHQSTFFETLLLGPFAESGKDEVVLKDIDPKDFQNFLEVVFMEPTLTDSCIEGVLHISDMYDAKNVRRICEEFLMNKSNHSLKKKLQLSISFKLEKTQKFCIEKMESSADVRSAMTGEITDPAVLTALLDRNLSLKK